MFREYGQQLLKTADEIWIKASGPVYLDTAVRDEIAQGLGSLVHAAYDALASSMEIPDTAAWLAFIDNATAEWFRQRGFAEWFCLAAAQSFNTSRPRTLLQRMPVKHRARKA